MRAPPRPSARKGCAAPPACPKRHFTTDAIRLFVDAASTSVRVTFRGVTESGPDPDWRWGLVATDSAVTTARYSGGGGCARAGVTAYVGPYTTVDSGASVSGDASAAHGGHWG